MHLDRKEKRTKIFLIIGLTKEAAHWDETFCEQLTEMLSVSSEDIIAVDLPGAGAFLSEESPNSIRGIVERTRPRYLPQIEDSEERIVIAISLGGMIAMDWVQHYPQDFHRLVILNSSFRGLSPVYKRLQPKAMKSFVQIFRAPSTEQREKGVIELCCNDESKHEAVLQKWVEIADLRPMKKGNMVRQTLAAARYRFKAPPPIPVFVIASRYDQLASYTCSQRLHSRLGGQFYLFEDEKVGHAIHIDAPIRLAEQITRWLK